MSLLQTPTHELANAIRVPLNNVVVPCGSVLVVVFMAFFVSRRRNLQDVLYEQQQRRPAE